jgi:hypothetical protein
MNPKLIVNRIIGLKSIFSASKLQAQNTPNAVSFIPPVVDFSNRTQPLVVGLPAPFFLVERLWPKLESRAIKKIICFDLICRQTLLAAFGV